MFTSGTTVCLFIDWPRKEEWEVVGTQGVMEAAYIFMSGSKRRRANLGVSMKMSNGKVKFYKASRILSIPALMVNGCLGDYSERGTHGPFCVFWGEGNCVFLWEGCFVRSTVNSKLRNAPEVPGFWRTCSNVSQKRTMFLICSSVRKEHSCLPWLCLETQTFSSEKEEKCFLLRYLILSSMA